jgi:hypothetical protein
MRQRRKDGRISRRNFIKAAGVSSALLGSDLLRGANTVMGQDGDRTSELNQLFAPSELFAPGSLQILLTDSPLLEYDDRRIINEATIEFSQIDEWNSLELTGIPEHQFLINVRHRGWFTELELQVVVQGMPWKSLLMQNRSDQKINRMWINRGYIHGDHGSACFPAFDAPEPFAGVVWFSTLDHSSREILENSYHEFRYGETPQGGVSFDLIDGYGYFNEWRIHPDSSGRDYHTQWYRGDELLSQTVESVFEMNVAGCTSLPTASYCDRDDI